MYNVAKFILGILFIYTICMANTVIAGNGEDEIQRTLYFAGYDWTVRTGTGGPGPNYWSNSQESVWVDENGYLHLKIRKIGSTWYCAEVYTNHYTQYGTHKFVVEGDIDKPDKSTVLGLFTYADDTHEIDIEFSHWGNLDYTKIASYTIQPYTTAENSYPFEVNIDSMVSTHLFDWQQNFIAFTSYQGQKNSPANLLKTWVYTGQSIPNDTDRLRTHINYWLFQGTAPVDTSNLEVIIRNVEQPKPLGTQIEMIPDSELKSFKLEQNYPNPFNPVTVIGYQLSVNSRIDLSIYNQLGQKVQTLVSGRQPVGRYQINWDTRDLASGIYYYQLTAGSLREVKKMMLIR